ncbi:MAG: hypothetical protein SGARI_003691, partial [Bacillariaceae sp.]
MCFPTAQEVMYHVDDDASFEEISPCPLEAQLSEAFQAEGGNLFGKPFQMNNDHCDCESSNMDDSEADGIFPSEPLPLMHSVSMPGMLCSLLNNCCTKIDNDRNKPCLVVCPEPSEPSPTQSPPTKPVKLPSALPVNTTIITEPGEWDIVCGRNSGGLNYTGNRRFRVQVMMNLSRYLGSKSRDQKSQVIQALFDTLQDDIGARFVKKVGKGKYGLLGDKEGRKKVAHTMRDFVQEHKKAVLPAGRPS